MFRWFAALLLVAILSWLAPAMASAQGSITGTVTSDTAAPLQNVRVSAYDPPTNQFVASGVTDASGNYTIPNLGAGFYLVAAENEDLATDWIGEAHPNLPCTGFCSPFVLSAGEPVQVSDPGPPTDVDFQLNPAGRITGTVTGAGSGPLTPLTVWADFPGQPLGLIEQFANTNASGVYVLRNLRPAAYRVFTQTDIGWVNEVHPNVACVISCENPNAGTPVTVTLPGPTAGIDFDLDLGGSISGTVTNGMTSMPVLVGMRLHGSNGAEVGSAGTTPPNGEYLMTGVPPGTYFVSTTTVSGVLTEVYNNVQCGPTLCVQAAVLTGTPIVVTAGVTESGKDFVLTAGGAISGTIRNAATNAPISGYQVRLFRAPSTTVANATTNGSGVYTFSNLLNGTYYLGTVSNTGLYTNEIYPNIECGPFPPTCQGSAAVNTGTAITVSAPATTSGIDLALDQLGAISGTLRDDNLMPLAGIDVTAITENPFLVSTATTNGSGVYTITGLKSASYSVFTEATTGGWVNEVYDNIPCEGFCNPDAPGVTKVAVVAPATVNGIDFTLSQTGVISGTVVDEVTNQPLTGGAVIALTLEQGSVGFAPIISGSYSLSGLPIANYYLIASVSGYYDEVWNNVRCDGCNPFLLGTPTTLVLGQTITRSFTLSKAGQITGTVTNEAGAPVQVLVTAVDQTGDVVVSSFSSSFNGQYTLGPLPSGSFYLYTSGNVPYGHEYWNNVPCIGACDATGALANGSSVSVVEGQTTSARNFALSAQSHITGTVTDAGTGAPIPFATVKAVHAPTQRQATATANAAGQYDLAVGVAGPYFLFTDVTQRVNEVHDNHPCSGTCATTEWNRGTPIVASPSAPVTGKDFALETGGVITGRVISAATGGPLAQVTVVALDSRQRVIRFATTNSLGQFTFLSVVSGSYVLYSSGASLHGYVDEIDEDVPCPNSCSDDLALRLGRRRTLTNGGSVGVEMALSIGGRITGSVLDAQTGFPLPGVQVYVLNAQGTVGIGQADAVGYYSVIGLASGRYHLYTTNAGPYINEIYPGASCGGECGLLGQASATVAVTAGAATTGINFALDRGGQIAGRVTDELLGFGISFAGVTVFNARRQPVSSTAVDANGNFISAGLPTGTYYLQASPFFLYLPEVYENLPCMTNCQALLDTTATPIQVTAGATTAGKDFALTSGGSIVGTVVREADGVPLPAGVVSIYDADGRHVSNAVPDSTGVYVSQALRVGTYYVATAGTPGLIDESYNDRPCTGECTRSHILGSQAITITNDQLFASGIDFALATDAGVPGAPRSLHATNDERGVVLQWFGPTTGGVLVSYVVEAGLAPGAAAISIPVTETMLAVPNLPPGTYFVRVRGVNGAGTGAASNELTLTVGAATLVAPQPPVGLEARMVGSTLFVTWAAASSGGQPTDYVLEAGSATGLSNFASLALDTTSFVLESVPDGVYFLRVRARNAVGTSDASAEFMLVVGNVPAPPLPPTLYPPDVAGSTVTFGWVAPTGSVLGYIFEAGTAPGRADLTATLGPETILTIPNVPPGVYYVRLRAGNAQGLSSVSNEVVVIVQ